MTVDELTRAKSTARLIGPVSVPVLSSEQALQTLELAIRERAARCSAIWRRS